MKNVYHKVPKGMIPEEIVIEVCWRIGAFYKGKGGEVRYDTDTMREAFEEALNNLPEYTIKEA